MAGIKKNQPRAGGLHKAFLLVGSAACVSACVNTGIPVEHIAEPELKVSLYKAPLDTREGSCWARDETPATIQTTTQSTLVKPAEIDADGTQISPAEYRTETRQEIVQQRDEIWFETPCSESIGEDFILNLQRALKVRGYYDGPINGMMDASTRSSVRKFQQVQGLNSSILSLEAARQFGLQNYILK